MPHLLPPHPSRLLEKIVFFFKMLPLVINLEPRLHVLCQRAVAHHEHLAKKKMTGETPEVRSDKRKQERKKREKRERKERKRERKETKR